MTENENLAEAFNANNAPFAKMMGVRMTRVSKERIEAELEVTPDHCTIPATLHGGAIMAFADNLGGVGAFLNMLEGGRTSTVESKTNFLRPVPVGQTAKAVTTPVHIGRTLQSRESANPLQLSISYNVILGFMPSISGGRENGLRCSEQVPA